MTTSRLATLLAVIAFGMGAVFLLPRSAEQPVGIRVELPEHVGTWIGRDAELSENERTTLGEKSGTQFARKLYRNLDGYEILVSIVLSGRDMSTAIHRPERCLMAQGWTLQGRAPLNIELPQRGAFPVELLRSTRLVERDGGTAATELQTLYWFVGEHAVTAGHWSRWMIDNRDRLFRGVNQRWAYILVSGGVPSPKDPNLKEEYRRLTQNLMREFITTLAPKIHLDTVQYQ